MAWGRPKRGGWVVTDEAEAGNRFTQIIRTIVSVAPGGVIRAGKGGPDDDGHVGFWLGVTTDGVARFSVGGPSFWLKWDGYQLLVRGKISTLSGDNPDDRVRWVGVDGEDVAYVQATDAWGHQLEMGVPRPDSAGDPGMLDLFVDGDFAAGVRVRLQTERGAGPAGTKVLVLVGNMEVFSIDGAGNVHAAGQITGGG